MSDGRDKSDGRNWPARIEADVGDIRRTVQRLEVAIVGDPKFAQPGVIGRQADHEKRLETIERERADEASQRKGAGRLLAAVAAVASAVGGLIGWGVSLFQHGGG